MPKCLQPMLATLTDMPFDDIGWIFVERHRRADNDVLASLDRADLVFGHASVDLRTVLRLDLHSGVSGVHDMQSAGRVTQCDTALFLYVLPRWVAKW
jgi:hypothetical protein